MAKQLGIWDKLIGGSFDGILTGVSKILDETITTKEEKLLAQKKITEVIENAKKDITQIKADVVKSELTGNWLQRSWRPILMLMFGFIIIYEYFLSKIFHLPSANLPPDFWDLLNLGIGGYVIGRSVEKVATGITIKTK